MTNTNTAGVTLHFTREFTGGTLKGIRHDDSITFVSQERATRWLEAARKGIKPYAGSPYKVVEASF